MERLSNSSIQVELFDVESLSSSPESVSTESGIFDFKFLGSKVVPCQRGWFLDSLEVLYVDAKFEQSFYRVSHPFFEFVTYSPSLRSALKFCSSYDTKHSFTFFYKHCLLDLCSVLKSVHHDRIKL